MAASIIPKTETLSKKTQEKPKKIKMRGFSMARK